MKYLFLLFPFYSFSQVRDTVPTILLVSDTSNIDRSTVVSGVMNSGYSLYSPRQYAFYLRGWVVRNRTDLMGQNGIYYVWTPTNIYLDENKKPLPKSIYVWPTTAK